MKMEKKYIFLDVDGTLYSSRSSGFGKKGN